MTDFNQATILCEPCNTKAEKAMVNKAGCSLRAWKCPSCDKEWIHPVDQEEYKRFKSLAEKTFRVKLRLVGNSYAISIPREIISFQEEILDELDSMINLSLDSPERLTILFSKRSEKPY